jgi:hypothetical protein
VSEGTEIPASSLGIGPGNSVALNKQLYYSAWANKTDPAFVGSTLLFDKPGIWGFDGKLIIPVWRRIRGFVPKKQDAVFLRYFGPYLPDGFIELGQTEGFLEDLAVSVQDGTTQNGLADYCIRNGDRATNKNGKTLHLNNVQLTHATQAQLYAFNSYQQLHKLKGSLGKTCVHLECCSEIAMTESSFTFATEACVRLNGLGDGQPNGKNGGRFSAFNFVGANAPIGLDLNGIGALVIVAFTFEGSTDVSLRMRECTNTWVLGSRMNAGDQVIFDASNLCTVWGGGRTGSNDSQYRVRHINGSRMCRAFTAAESYVFPQDVMQHFESGGQIWRAYCRTDGRIISVDNTPPTAGHWEYGDLVYALSADPGEPWVWFCYERGDPGLWRVAGRIE